MDASVRENKHILFEHSYIELDIIKWCAQNITKDVEVFLKPDSTLDIRWLPAPVTNMQKCQP